MVDTDVSFCANTSRTVCGVRAVGIIAQVSWYWCVCGHAGPQVRESSAGSRLVISSHTTPSPMFVEVLQTLTRSLSSRK